VSDERPRAPLRRHSPWARRGARRRWDRPLPRRARALLGLRPHALLRLPGQAREGRDGPADVRDRQPQRPFSHHHDGLHRDDPRLPGRPPDQARRPRLQPDRRDLPRAPRARPCGLHRRPHARDARRGRHRRRDRVDGRHRASRRAPHVRGRSHRLPHRAAFPREPRHDDRARRLGGVRGLSDGDGHGVGSIRRALRHLLQPPARRLRRPRHRTRQVHRLRFGHPHRERGLGALDLRRFGGRRVGDDAPS
jgi:hypothetical protein